ncbi:MAG TPA: hypothetical protein VFO25_08585 [Candidatus Eremiobacteraceae bacterium]|nr:hypothetical protein [Candidatus Eremiobacteraceae bacterium]
MPRRRVVLANLDRPPDTSRLVVCDDEVTAFAVETTRTRLMQRRRSLLRRAPPAGDIDRIVGSLRRLQNPHIAAYQLGDALIVSEPFNAVPSIVAPASTRVATRAVRAMFDARPPAKIVKALSAFGENALAAAVAGDVHISIVPERKRYAEFSRAVARLVPGIDDWSAPPSGLFVVEEKRILLRDRAMTMTVAHEFAHALDAVLAKKPRSYFSYESEELRRCFATTAGFVNEYAASALDEYFAESVRAYLEINDSHCAWLPLTRFDLKARDPKMFALIEKVFESGLRRSDYVEVSAPPVDSSVLLTVPGSR